MALGNLIENWHVSDFHISKARPEQEAGYAEHLSREGENLSLVVQYLHNSHDKIFKKILNLLKKRVPGISDVDSKTTEEGRVLLKFQDGVFEECFFSKSHLREKCLQEFRSGSGNLHKPLSGKSATKKALKWA